MRLGAGRMYEGGLAMATYPSHTTSSTTMLIGSARPPRPRRPSSEARSPRGATPEGARVARAGCVAGAPAYGVSGVVALATRANGLLAQHPHLLELAANLCHNRVRKWGKWRAHARRADLPTQVHGHLHALVSVLRRLAHAVHRLLQDVHPLVEPARPGQVIAEGSGH